MELFAVEYAVAGSNCNGLYLIYTANKDDAISCVANLNEDYCKVQAEQVQDPDDLYEGDVFGCAPSDLINEDQVKSAIQTPDTPIYLMSGS